MAGCATRTPAPVVERTPLAALPAPPATLPPPAPPVQPVVPTYTVKRGDTLHVIALDKGVDTRDLAAWNNLDNPNRLNVGQVLRLAPPGAGTASGAEPLPIPGPTDASGPGVVTAPLRTAPLPSEGRADAGVNAPAALTGSRTADNYKSSPKAIKEPYSEQAMRDYGKLAAAAGAQGGEASAGPGSSPARSESSLPPTRSTSPAIGSDDDRLDWMWPAKGKILGTFSENANLKGIDIAGTVGTAVVASAGGKVVYAGAGLRGYGKLVIIKHNDTYLSAYAHNREILVKEGDAVARGQKIAEMGNTDADQVKLHFEIRRLGKPMDPTKYLPPA